MNAFNLPLGLVKGPGLLGIAPQQQQPQEAFQWGAGGQRMTRDAIERQRQIAASLMQADTSPVYDPWQGIARVLQNVVGGFQERGLRKRERENNEYSQQIMNELIGGPLPAAEGGAGSSPPASPSPDRFAAIMADPYASDSVKQMAKMQYEQAINRQNKIFEYANREQPEIIRLQQLVDDPNTPASVKATAQKAIEAKVNPMITALLPEGGFYHGPTGGLPTALGGASQAPQKSGGPQVGAVVDGFRFNGGDPSDRNSWSPVGSGSGAAAQVVNPMASAEASKTISRSQLSPILSTYGRSGTDAWLKNYGIKVID